LLTAHFADKPTHGQSSHELSTHGLIKSLTANFKFTQKLHSLFILNQTLMIT